MHVQHPERMIHHEAQHLRAVSFAPVRGLERYGDFTVTVLGVVIAQVDVPYEGRSFFFRLDDEVQQVLVQL